MVGNGLYMQLTDSTIFAEVDLACKIELHLVTFPSFGPA